MIIKLLETVTKNTKDHFLNKLIFHRKTPMNKIILMKVSLINNISSL